MGARRCLKVRVPALKSLPQACSRSAAAAPTTVSVPPAGALAIGQHDGIFLDTAAGASQPHIRRLFICPAMGGELQAGVFARGPSDRRRLPATRVMSKEPSRQCCISEFLSREMTISEIRASGSSSPPSAKIGRPPRSLFRNPIMVYSMNSSPMVAVPFRGGSRAQRR
jgi:hypothetical protein